MSNEYKVSSATIAESMNMVSDAKNGLRSAQASLESASYGLKKESSRLFAIMLALEGRKTVHDPVNTELSSKNDAALTLLDAECQAAEDKQKEYQSVIYFIGKALKELEEQ